MNSNNLQISEDGELIFIDFQDTGKGHVFHDFVTFEVCLRLYHNSGKDFDSLLKIENKLNLDDQLEEGEYLFGSCIEKIRQLAKVNFPDEDFRTYFFSLAMRTFRLFRNADSFTETQTHALLACLLENLKLLHTNEHDDTRR